MYYLSVSDVNSNMINGFTITIKYQVARLNLIHGNVGTVLSL